MRLLLALRAIEDIRDEKELDDYVEHKQLISELHECLEVLRRYAGDTTENGLPAYVAFLWGAKKGNGRYVPNELRIYTSVKKAELIMKTGGYTHYQVVSTLEQCEELRKKVNRKDLSWAIDYYLNWCTKNKVQPFRYLK